MAERGKSILADLNVSGCDVAELQQVLGSLFRGCGGDRGDTHAYLFPGDQESYAIKLLFNNKHDLVDAIAGPTLTPDALNATRTAIVNALHTTDGKIANWILFSPVPVNGAFRYRDDFQILPAPVHAPQPNAILAEHPFLLQFRYKGSAHQTVDIRRRVLHGRGLEFLLAAMLHSRIYSHQGVHHAWVIDPDSIGVASVSRTVYWQLGYTYADHKPTLKDFTPIDQLPQLSVINGAEFLGRLGIDGGQALDLPDYFERLATAYFSLDESDARKFRNAGYWFQHSARTYPTSRSASYVSLALAVEALMPPPEPGKGPTKQFKEFLARFVPATDGFKEQTEQLYKTRSKLAHGASLLVSDHDRLMAHSPAWFEEWRQSDYFYSVVRYAIVNWLNDRAHRRLQSAAT